MSGLDEPRRGQGREGENRRSRIAARIGDQTRARNLVAVQFGQTVDGVLDVRRMRVLAVPLLVLPQVLQAVVRADVDGSDARLDERRQPLGAGLMRQGREDDIDALGYVFGYRQIDRREMRKDIAQPLSDGAPTGDGGYLGFGVSRQDTRKLDARVSRDVDDAYFHLNPLGRSLPC